MLKTNFRDEWDDGAWFNGASSTDETFKQTPVIRACLCGDLLCTNCV
ncbi:hypothetical protein IKQ19_17215 [Candidatus Saccharibacteria bacterium]|nr:hypothetical protein [Candidatus Saccharibacteria bacterium]